MSDTAPAEVEGTYAEYLALMLKASKSNPANGLQQRLNAALDADELVRKALGRVDSFVDALAALDGGQVLARMEHDTGEVDELLLDDVRVVLGALRRHPGYSVG